MLKIGLLERTLVSKLPPTYHAHDHIFEFKTIEQGSFACWKDCHSILDLVHHKKFFRKELNFAEQIMLKLSGQGEVFTYEDDQGNMVDLSAYSMAWSSTDITGYLVECLSRTEQRGKMLVLVPRGDVQQLTKEQLYLYLFHNIFVNLKLGTQPCASIPWDQMKTKVCPHPRMHWVWFRKQGYKLNPEILRCTQTWIEANPEVTFNLWTNIRDIAELDDFLSDLDEANKKLFQDTIHVKFLDELLDYVPLSLQTVITSDDPKDMILKTDVFRLLILQKHGGFYSDFNDSVCFVPLKYLFHNTEDQCLFAADDNDNVIDNYFIYAPPRHPWINRCLSEILADVPILHTFLHHNRMGNLYVDCAIEFVKALLEQTFRSRLTIMNVMSMALHDFNERFQQFIRTSTPPMPPKMLKRILQEPQYCHAHLVLITLELLGVLPAVLEQGLKEIVNTRNMQFGQSIQWLNGNMTDQFDTAQIPKDESVLTALKALQYDEDFHHKFRFRFVRRFPGSFMQHTNIGTIIQQDRKANPRLRVNVLPCCDFRYAVSMVTAISHIRDGTCTGGEKGHGEVISDVL